MKRQSAAPRPPPDLNVFGFQLPSPLVQPLLGGPCRGDVVACLCGPQKGELCGVPCVDKRRELCGDHSVCGDPDLELCDACPAQGGITTEDEMFIFLGSYFLAPEPSQVLLGLSALGVIGLLARGRRRR